MRTNRRVSTRGGTNWRTVLAMKVPGAYSSISGERGGGGGYVTPDLHHETINISREGGSTRKKAMVIEN